MAEITEFYQNIIMPFFLLRIFLMIWFKKSGCFEATNDKSLVKCPDSFLEFEWYFMDLVDQKACKFLHKIDELRPQCSCSRTGPTSYPSFLQSLALSSSVFVLIRKAQGLSWPHFWFSAVCRTRPVSLINAIGRTIPFGSFLFVIIHLDGLYW